MRKLAKRSIAKLKVVFFCISASIASVVFFFLLFFVLIPLDTGRLAYPANTVFRDRDGHVLRFLPDERGERHLWAGLEEIPVRLRNAFIAAEDERFFDHHGFDPQAILRAVCSNVKEGRVVSGASTLSQQLIRILYPSSRTYSTKIGEIVRAVKLERRLSKEEVLEHYLNRVPMGNNLVGVKLGARTYFGKAMDRLTVAECALLASLPKAPGRLNPYHEDRSRLLQRRNWVLHRMCELRFVEEKDRKRFVAEPIETIGKRFPLEAPHLVEMLLAEGLQTSGDVSTTIDLNLQHRIEEVLRSHRRRLGYRGARQASAMVVRNESMEVLALAGSFEYGGEDGGCNNGVTALRSPGSTLKPFLYGLAVEEGDSASTLLEDTKRWYRAPLGDYLPTNYDLREYGPVTIRTALGNSLNLAAVRMLNRVGIPGFHEFLIRLGLLDSAAKGPDYYGLGLAIGNPEVTMVRLVTGYAMLANGGERKKLRYLISEDADASISVLSPQTAFIITDILSDPTARALSFGSCAELDFPYRVAWKTGTSTGYRDCWIVGFTPEYTVGVWVGNFEGDPTYNLSGSTGAGPIFAEIVRCLYGDGSPGHFIPPPGLERHLVCGLSGQKPNRKCMHFVSEWFAEDSAPGEVCEFHKKTDAAIHELPSAYAGWIHDRRNREIDSGFTLRRTTSTDGEARQTDGELPEGNQVRVTIGTGLDQNRRLFGVNRGTVQFLYPLDGDRFIAGAATQRERIKLKVRVTEPAEKVTWFVDGVEHSEAAAPYETTWNLSRGTHRIVAAAGIGSGDEIEVHVE